MIELRGRRKIGLAQETLKAYQTTLTDHMVLVPKGTRVYDIPSFVLGEGDRYGIHIQSNMVEIIRMAKGVIPPCVDRGRTTRRLSFGFNQRGRLRVGRGTR